MALSVYALTSLADCKTYMRITSADDDALITELINAATRYIEVLTSRRLAAREHKQWVDGRNSRRLVLDNYPILEVNRVAYGRASAIDATYTGTGIRASIQVTSAAVITRSWSTTGVLTSTSSTFATNASTSALVTALDAISGWDGTLRTNVPADDLCPLAGQPALNVTVGLYYPPLDQNVNIIDAAAGILELDRSPGWSQAWEGRSLPVGYGSFYPRGFLEVLVEYRAGFESISSAVETSDLAQVCREIVAEAWQRRGLNTNVASESLGDYSYSLVRQMDLAADRAARLRPWTTPPVGRRAA